MRGTVLLVAGRDPRDEPAAGHSSYVRAHARAALAAGFEVHLLGAGKRVGVEAADYGSLHGVRSSLFPVRQLFVAFYQPRLERAIIAFAAQCASPLVLHGFGVWGAVAVSAARRLRRPGRRVPVVVSSYTTYGAEKRAAMISARNYGALARLRYRAEYGWARLATGAAERRAYCGADCLAFNYESVRRLIELRYPSRPRYLKLPYASESAFTRRSRPFVAPPRELAALAPAAGPLLVSVANHDPRKGATVLLEAMALLRTAGIPFRGCLVGGGARLEDHRRLARQLGLDGQVILTGMVPDVFAFLDAADVFVLPSRSEQSGSLALLEALQAGCPAVASAVDGIPEDVRDGAEALLVPPGDPRALATALGRLLTDPELRAELGRGARSLFDRRFASEPFAAALGALYTELIEAT